jgi:hypothetical protein
MPHKSPLPPGKSRSLQISEWQTVRRIAFRRCRSRRSSAARSRLMSADRKISSSCARVVALTMGFEGGVGRTQDIGLRKTPSEGFHRPSYKRSSSYAIRSPGTRRRMVDRVRQDTVRKESKVLFESPSPHPNPISCADRFLRLLHRMGMDE